MSRVAFLRCSGGLFRDGYCRMPCPLSSCKYALWMKYWVLEIFSTWSLPDYLVQVPCLHSCRCLWCLIRSGLLSSFTVFAMVVGVKSVLNGSWRIVAIASSEIEDSYHSCQWAGQTFQRSGLELSQWFWAHEQHQTCMERPQNCMSTANWRSSAILSHQLFYICQVLRSFCLACCFMECWWGCWSHSH